MIDISLLIAKHLGVFYLILTFAFIQKRAYLAAFIDDFLSNDLMIFLYGISTLGLGLLVYIIHPIWVWNWRVIITLISIFWTLKGLTSLFFAHHLKNRAHIWMRPEAINCGIGILFSTAIVLLYCAYYLN